MITNFADLKQYYYDLGSRYDPFKEFLFVTSKARREIMCGESQGKFIFKGCVVKVCFTSVGGGVWEARIEK